jgi:hypothetical protein
MYTLSNVRITQNGVVYLVPCELLPYLSEIKALVATTSVTNAFLEVANNHNIVLFKKEPLKTVRQQPPAAPIKLRLAQPVDYFILTTVAGQFDVIEPSGYTLYTDDAKFISTFNVKSESMTYATMNEKTALVTLFKGAFPKPAICTSIDNSNLRDCTGLIVENRDKLLVFIPCVYSKLRYLYTPFSDNCSVFFKQIGCTLDQNSSSLLYKYTGSATL